MKGIQGRILRVVRSSPFLREFLSKRGEDRALLELHALHSLPWVKGKLYASIKEALELIALLPSAENRLLLYNQIISEVSDVSPILQILIKTNPGRCISVSDQAAMGIDVIGLSVRADLEGSLENTIRYLEALSEVKREHVHKLISIREELDSGFIVVTMGGVSRRVPRMALYEHNIQSLDDYTMRLMRRGWTFEREYPHIQ